MLFEKLKRKTIITGHYGSGKTEFAVSLAMLLATAEAKAQRIALIDLDVVNPYFRSRERREMLENAGVSVYGSVYTHDVTAEIPELGATVRAPLESPDTMTIIDLGGNDSGALIINQFSKYFTGGDCTMAAVVNANRPDTSTADGAIAQITAIESATKLTVTHLINNTHLLRETTVADIEKGHALCVDISAKTDKELLCDCYPDGIVDKNALTGLSDDLMPLGLYMRPSFLDR